VSGLELGYWIALGTGLGFLVLSILLGDIFDFFDIDIGDTGFPIVPVFFGATAAFGAGGLIGVKAFGFGTGGSIALGLGGGGFVGALIALLFALLRRQEGKEGFELAKLVGQRGRSTLAVGPGRTGRVAVHFAGMTRSLTATSKEDIPAGEEIVVRDVVGNVLTVSRPEAPEGSGVG
jgi:membrane protein implicated in regulation of membrane protease activity